MLVTETGLIIRQCSLRPPRSVPALAPITAPVGLITFLFTVRDAAHTMNSVKTEITAGVVIDAKLTHCQHIVAALCRSGFYTTCANSTQCSEH